MKPNKPMSVQLLSVTMGLNVNFIGMLPSFFYPPSYKQVMGLTNIQCSFMKSLFPVALNDH